MDFVFGFAVGIVIQVDVEALFGNVGDGVDFVQDIGPEGSHVGRFGQQAAHADDGYVERRGRRQNFFDASAHERHGEVGNRAAGQQRFDARIAGESFPIGILFGQLDLAADGVAQTLQHTWYGAELAREGGPG